MGDWKVPADLKFAESDEWFRVEGDVVTIGITDYAQEQLNDIVFVDLKEAGDSVSAGESFGEVESVKAASELYSVVGGEVVDVNASLEDEPEIINTEPYEGGWMIKIKVDDLSPLENLMDATAYAAYCDER